MITQQSKLCMVGECKALYEILYPILAISDQSPSLKSVSISSRLSRSLLAQNGFMFVAGNDGAIDVFKG